MEAECNIVYREDAGSILGPDFVNVVVRQWRHRGVEDYVICLTVDEEEAKKDIVDDGDLASAVRLGIKIFDAAVASHPVLGKHN